MTAWTIDELSTIGRADALELAPLQGDGMLRKGVTIWIVRHGDDLYVRSWRGRGGAWFRAAQARHAGHIQAGGIAKDSPSWRKPTRASMTRSTPSTAPSTAATRATSRQ